MKILIQISATAALAMCCSAAMAQAAPIAGVPVAPTITVPPPPCEKPPTTAGLQPDAKATKRWNKLIDDYKKCNVDYHNALNDYIKGYGAATNALVDASNKYLTDFNAFAAQVRKDNDIDDDEPDAKPGAK